MNSALITVIIPLLWIKGASSYSFLLHHCTFDHMASSELTFILFLLLSAGISPNQSKDVRQTPADLLWQTNDKVKLTCKHTINNYDTILWYHHSQGDSSLKLVGFTAYTSAQNVEKSFQGSFNVSGDGEKEAFLHLLKLSHPKDSGHYFCAAYSTP